MKYCFVWCEHLTSVTLKCNYAGKNFTEAFQYCSGLQTHSIKVPQGQLNAYKAGADDMGVDPDRFYE